MEHWPWDDDQERLLIVATQIFANFERVKTNPDLEPARAEHLANQAKWLAGLLIHQVSTIEED